MATREPMLDMFVFETNEMIEQLQQIMMESEKTKEIGQNAINEIFRIMHTIKGSSGMMMFDNISHLAHSIEDMFYFIRENKIEKIDFTSLADLVLEGGDLIREETESIDEGNEAETDFTDFIGKVNDYLTQLKLENGFKQEAEKPEKTNLAPAAKFYISNDKSRVHTECFAATLHFEEKCEMENVRCFTVLHKLSEIAEILYNEPEDILNDANAAELIRSQGFKVYFKTSQSQDAVRDFFNDTIFLESVQIEKFPDEAALLGKLGNGEPEQILVPEQYAGAVNQEEHRETEHSDSEGNAKKESKPGHKVNLISVDVDKLDKLMDLVGELVISESMVTNNSAAARIDRDDFHKAVRQHRKRISDLQDVVMSIRMVSLAPTLNKMNRIVRDMSKKLGKKAELIIVGENTEVDKNIIEHIGDPLMHIIRNSMDHGLEDEEERRNVCKNPVGSITIEAKNMGGDVLINVTDDGRGLDRDKILKRAIENGIIAGEGSGLSNKEIFATIFTPGLSTNDQVTEYSGRGVGMDVVIKEIEKVRGTVSVDSKKGEGTTVSIKIPLTIAILDGMIIKVGKSIFTIPVTSIKSSLIIKNKDVFKDLDNKEMISIRGECFSILRLHELYRIQTEVTDIEEGIVIMVEDGGKSICIFADELIGEQQVVIKALPEYIDKVKGTSGCTLLGNGCISLILDVAQLVNM